MPVRTPTPGTSSRRGPDPLRARVGLPHARQDPHTRDRLQVCMVGAGLLVLRTLLGPGPASGPHPSGWAQQRGLRQGLMERLGLRVASRAQERGRQRLWAWGCLVLPEASRGDCWGGH